MSESRVPVDLLNPGQVFACLGLMEIAQRLLGVVRAGFDWSDPERTTFLLRAESGEGPPVLAALEFLRTAEVAAAIPKESELSMDRWGAVESRVLTDDDPFPIPEPNSPATLPAELRTQAATIAIHHWGDTKRDNVKFWAGMGGYPGVALLKDALDLIRPHLGEVAADPFALSAPQSSSFRFDWRHDYVPLDAGFSLNQHNYIQSRGFPLVEILAAVGLTHARPVRPDRRDKLKYRYGVVGRAPGRAASAALLPPALIRAALGAPNSLPLDIRLFTMQLDWPGQQGQARCITSVTEESS